MTKQAEHDREAMLLTNARNWQIERAEELERDGEAADRHRRIAMKLDR